MSRRKLPEGWVDYATAVGSNIQRFRVQQGLSQEELTYAAGLSRYALQLFERGGNDGRPANPQLSNIMAIAQVLGVGLQDLLPSDWPEMSDGVVVRKPKLESKPESKAESKSEGKPALIPGDGIASEPAANFAASPKSR